MRDLRRAYIGYTTGFALSVLLTLAAYALVVNRWHVGALLTFVIISLAVVQLWVQLRFFLHLSSEEKPYWKSIAFMFALVVVGILVLGSLWIMNNLNYHTMSPSDTMNYMLKNEGI
jgi:cytochrome o ubiquinol oxidase operon protein cyoD